MTRIDFGFDSNEVVLVTGAGSGIGRATAIGAAALGLRVSAWDINPDALAATAAEIRGGGGTVHEWVADIGDDDAIDAGIASAVAALGPVAYVHNNAGPPSSVPIDFRRASDLSLRSVWKVTQAWTDSGIPERAAMVITTSVAGNRLAPPFDWYAIVKAGLQGYVRHLAAHRAQEFRTNGVAPGPTETARMQNMGDSPWGRRVLERVPLHRFGQPDDVAYATLFLLSPLASYLNGVFLPVDGGWSVAE